MIFHLFLVSVIPKLPLTVKLRYALIPNAYGYSFSSLSSCIYGVYGVAIMHRRNFCIFSAKSGISLELYSSVEKCLFHSLALFFNLLAKEQDSICFVWGQWGFICQSILLIQANKSKSLSSNIFYQDIFDSACALSVFGAFDMGYGHNFELVSFAENKFLATWAAFGEKMWKLNFFLEVCVCIESTWTGLNWACVLLCL